MLGKLQYLTYYIFICKTPQINERKFTIIFLSKHKTNKNTENISIGIIIIVVSVIIYNTLNSTITFKINKSVAHIYNYFALYVYKIFKKQSISRTWNL